jgi:DnaK suppressor protein
MPVNASGLTEKQLKELGKTLQTKLQSLNSEIRELEASLTDEETEDKGAPDEVDRSSFEEEMQRMQLVLDGKKQLQFEVMEAIKRIEEGSYGVCEETEEPIGIKRLTAQPWTRLSLEAQQEFERRKKNSAFGGRHAAGYPSAYDSEKASGGESSDD